jgi:hypothetical protein
VAAFVPKQRGKIGGRGPALARHTEECLEVPGHRQHTVGRRLWHTAVGARERERERKGASGGGWHVGWPVGWGPVGCGEGGYDRWPEPGKEKKEK